MAFDVTEVARLFPAFLSDTEKDRITQGLSQFGESVATTPKLYNDFFATGVSEYLLQGDLLPSIRLPIWQSEPATFSKGYTNALLIANTCDVDVVGNARNVPKEVGFVPLVPLSDFIAALTRKLQTQALNPATIKTKLQNIEKELKGQLLTNVFYLPASPTGLPECVALLDRPFWFPSSELVTVGPELLKHRLATLSQWGYYLFILKLSYHLCRLPEERDRN